jgi:purine-nucleoside phosphorylase
MLASTYVERLEKATKYVHDKIQERPDIGVVLGSGLGSYGDELTNPIRIPYKEIPGMLDTTVPGHFGCLIYGMIGERKVLCLSGRSHQYEGLHPHEIQFAIRLLGLCGCRLVILTNAAGTRDPELNVGDLAPMLDHLNFTHRGYTEEPLCVKDFDHLIQNDMYDAAALKTAHDIAVELKLQTKGCAYTYNMGPVYETHAEVEGQYILGCTNFGMSTVGEVIAAKSIGVPILAMSFVTNKAAGVCEEVLTHEDVAKAAKAGEPNMRALISTTIKRVPLKEFPIPQLKGDDRNIARAEPANFASEETIAEAAKLFGETKIDAAVILTGTHKLAIEPKVTVSVNDLPEFPVMTHTRAQLKIGEVAGKNVAVIDGIYDFCGFDHFELFYIMQLFAKLGAKKVIQTFAAGTFGEHGAQLVKDFIPLWERPIRVPKACPCYKPAEDAKAILVSYHGPEFWTQKEAGGMKAIGATHATLGATIGMQIATALKLEAAAIVDGSFDAIIKEDQTTEKIVEESRKQAEAVEKLIVAEIAKVEGASPIAASFKAGDKKALQWNDLPAHPINKQENPEEVKEISEKLPDVAAVYVFECENSGFESVKKLFTSEIDCAGEKLHLGKIEGKDVAFAIASRKLCRACAAKKILVVGVGIVIPTTDDLKEGEFVQFIDHMNIVGISPLMGSNKFGTRFPDMSHLYKQAKDLKPIQAFNLPALYLGTPSYKAAAKIMGNDALTQFGVIEATVTRHSEGLYTHIAIVEKCPCHAWTVDSAVLAKAL